MKLYKRGRILGINLFNLQHTSSQHLVIPRKDASQVLPSYCYKAKLRASPALDSASTRPATTSSTRRIPWRQER